MYILTSCLIDSGWVQTIHSLISLISQIRTQITAASVHHSNNIKSQNTAILPHSFHFHMFLRVSKESSINLNFRPFQILPIRRTAQNTAQHSFFGSPYTHGSEESDYHGDRAHAHPIARVPASSGVDWLAIGCLEHGRQYNRIQESNAEITHRLAYRVWECGGVRSTRLVFLHNEGGWHWLWNCSSCRELCIQKGFEYLLTESFGSWFEYLWVASGFGCNEIGRECS